VPKPNAAPGTSSQVSGFCCLSAEVAGGIVCCVEVQQAESVCGWEQERRLWTEGFQFG
jgi:hypothetical protein